MRLRFWIGLVAAVVVGAGAVVGSILVYDHDNGEFHTRQREEASRAARQAQSVGALSVGELAAAASFIKANQHLSKHQFAVVAQSLVKEEVLHAAAFIDVVHAGERAKYEREHGFPIIEKTPPGKSSKRRPRRSTTHSPTALPSTKNSPPRGWASTSPPTQNEAPT